MMSNLTFKAILLVALLGISNRAELNGAQTVDIVDELEPEAFWSLLPDVNLTWNGGDPWSIPLVRYYFFKGCPFSFDSSSTITFEKTKRLKKTVGLEGYTENEAYIALDIPYHPVVSSNSYHARYGDQGLFPRWSGLGYMSRYYPYIFSHRSFLFYYRAQELADFALYAQYDDVGRNRFLEDFYREEWEAVQERKNVTKWRYGWPDWMMETWTDAYGYSWIRFEPDHHVLAGSPVFWLVKWYELTGEEKYLDAAYNFLYYQVPRFGFHKGLWKGIPYYWTGYDPGYPSFPNRRELPPAQDVTNNIQALVAKGLASAAYHKRDGRMMELARGLLWYLCRSFEIDGRWYYDGPDNPLAERKVSSHELVCVSDSMTALLYLYKAGMDVNHLIEGLEPAIKFYTLHRVPTKPKPEPASPNDLITAYKLMSTSKPEVGRELYFSTLFQVRLEDAPKVRFYDRVSSATFEYDPSNLTLRLYELEDGGWREVWKRPIEAGELARGVDLLENPKVYGIYRVEYGPLKPKASDFTVEPSTIRVGTAERVATTQQPRYNMEVNSTSFIETMALIMFPKEPSDPRVTSMRTPRNLLPAPLLTDEERNRFVSPEAKEAISQALKRLEEAQRAFREERLEEARENLEEALNLVNEAALLDVHHFERLRKIILGAGLGVAAFAAAFLLIRFLRRWRRPK